MNLAVVVLAAGQGTRMKSQVPKVLHPVLGRPMIRYVIDTLNRLKPDRKIIVINPLHDPVCNYLSGFDCEIAVQKKLLGTADALRSAFSLLHGFEGTVLVVNGDTPLISPVTLKKFLTRHHRSGSDISVLSFNAGDPSYYGRIIRNNSGSACMIVEEKDLSAGQKAIREVNSGVYAMKHNVEGLLGKIKKNPKKKEYYLTDILALASKRGLKSDVINIGLEEEFHGVNTMADLLAAQRLIQKGLINKLMKKGVRFLNPDSVIVHPDVRIAPDSVIYPSVCLEGRTVIGRSSKIFQGVRIVDSRIGRGVSVLDNSLIEGSRVDDESSVGPFARLRPDSIIGKNVKIGNFVEIKNSRILEGTKAGHLSYIGDATIGRNVNIGAGTITCNYDGVKKHRTVIGDEVFVGSDTQLIAPVRVGKRAFIAAGSTITEDVSANALAISRAGQKEIAGWSHKKFKKDGKE
ncbi:bifunctional protein GlmU [bacterium BMS3Abin07]|nr:bifunctional protein GlmU [bacterium BMS3Abin07]GBE33417.1 bifunctional protein GlmU [bacterium BMS3Bbin05]HDL21061.1 UDP-N-acetylglucosamine diphosphorylase/glucosamine-1-phosphate N-acetyltransferase [Nitrospirota bacterium]HDO21243.1 UDP-N-acetylglucosamine diphosphorylase/glucosamine-1-phosphate N-acetyltransferase [Nitrospirota bacterium]HDZ87544.1 UDP-N-acetylglucosamine diphosphorylase/glucosamine-1-phosphate N-acetyltransferase [Nitrospirota bacterium]